jgi:hypothetical protein
MTVADIEHASNFLVRVRCGTSTLYESDLSGFGSFGTDAESVIGLIVEVEAKYTGGTTSVDHVRVTANISSSDANITEGSTCYDSTLNMVTSNNGTSWESVALAAYPVGAIYISTVSTNPGTIFGGTWVAFGAGKTLVGLDSGDTAFDTVEETGGAKTHSLANANLPQYNGYVSFHGAGSATVLASASGSGITAGTTRTSYRSGGSNIAGVNSYDGFYLNIGQATPTPVSNLQPYIVTYMFKRTA